MELSVLIGFGGRGKLISLKVMRRGTVVLPLCKIPPTSDFSAEAITCLSIMHSVWIFPFYGGGRFGYFVGSDFRDLR